MKDTSFDSDHEQRESYMNQLQEVNESLNQEIEALKEEITKLKSDLRLKIAAMAMQGMIMHYGIHDLDVIEHSFFIADRMIAEDGKEKE